MEEGILKVCPGFLVDCSPMPVQVISEFLVEKERVPSVPLRWQRPQVLKMMVRDCFLMCFSQSYLYVLRLAVFYPFLSLLFDYIKSLYIILIPHISGSSDDYLSTWRLEARLKHKSQQDRETKDDFRWKMLWGS